MALVNRDTTHGCVLVQKSTELAPGLPQQSTTVGVHCVPCNNVRRSTAILVRSTCVDLVKANQLVHTNATVQGQMRLAARL